MATTVGELKKLLEQYSDDLSIVFLDDEGSYDDTIDAIGVQTLGVFARLSYPEYTYYRAYKLLESEMWIRDEEVLVLG